MTNIFIIHFVVCVCYIRMCMCVGIFESREPCMYVTTFNCHHVVTGQHTYQLILDTMNN